MQPECGVLAPTWHLDPAKKFCKYHPGCVLVGTEESSSADRPHSRAGTPVPRCMEAFDANKTVSCRPCPLPPPLNPKLRTVCPLQAQQMNA